LFFTNLMCFIWANFFRLFNNYTIFSSPNYAPLKSSVSERPFLTFYMPFRYFRGSSEILVLLAEILFLITELFFNKTEEL
jgi:hypothetical protein